ncbi:MAG: DUF547 domain-containing protein [Spirochaetaceae bacterium]
MHLMFRASSIRAVGHSVPLLLFVFLASVCTVQGVAAAPQAELWPRWEAHDAQSTTIIDHSEWGRIIDRYLVTGTESGVNLFRYADVSDTDRSALQAYIDRLSEVEVSRLNRDEQIAYWLNLYNAVTVELILEHYPVDSIRDITISGSAFNRHPWDAVLVEVEGEDLTLNDIEHRIIRPIWQDPRIHYAVNCASIGCPNLQPEPFTGANYRDLFDIAAGEYINHPRGARFEGNRLHLSEIFNWYSEDWDDDIAVIVGHLLEYAEDSLAEQLRSFADGGYRGRIAYSYDWNLNEP